MAKLDHNEFARSREVMLYVLPDFIVTELAAILDILQCANSVSGKELYTWNIVSNSEGAIESTAGIEVKASDFRTVSKPPDIMVFLDGKECKKHALELKTAVNWVRQRSSEMVILSDAVTSVSSTGFFGHKPVTAHWKELAAVDFELHPSVLDDAIFSESERMLTSGGYIATFDVMLYIIDKHLGRSFAAHVADILIKGEIREQCTKQRRSLQDRLGVDDVRVLKAVKIMKNYSYPDYSTSEIAKELNMSARHVERLFKKYFDQSPMKFFMGLKLEKAKSMVEQTSIPISEVAHICGFSSLSTFNRSFRRKFSVTPSSIRRAQLSELKSSLNRWERSNIH